MQVGALALAATGCGDEIVIDHGIDLFTPVQHATLVTSSDELVVSGCVAELACIEQLPSFAATIDGTTREVGVPDEPDFPEREQILDSLTLPGINFLRIPAPEDPTIGLLVADSTYTAQVPVAPLVGGVTGTPSRALPLRLDVEPSEGELAVHVRSDCGGNARASIITARGEPTPDATQSQIEPQAVLLLLDQLAPEQAEGTCTFDVLVFSRTTSPEPGLTIERMGLAPLVTFSTTP